MESCPTVFAFNVLGRVVQNFACNRLVRSPALAQMVSQQRLHLLPVPNYMPSSVEVRGLKLLQNLEGLLDRLGGTEFNLVAYSLAGVDARSALRASPALNVRLRRLLTVAAPHNGSEFLLALRDEQLPGDAVERVLNQLGVFHADLQEFSPSSMLSFNRNAGNADDPRFFSANGNTGFGRASPALQRVSEALLARKHRHVFGDGLFFPAETRLGDRHVAEFCADHFGLGPFSAAANENVFSFYADFCAVELGTASSA